MAVLVTFARPPSLRADGATPPAVDPIETSVGRLSRALASAIGDAAPNALVSSSPLTTDAVAPRASALSSLLAVTVASRLGRGAHPRRDPVALPMAMDEARRAGVLVALDVALFKGKVRVTADVYRLPKTVWGAAREPAPVPIAHAFAEAPFDGEIRAYLEPIPLTAARIDRASGVEADVLAIACGELEGGLAIVTLGRRRVTSLRVRGGVVVPLAAHAWSELSPIAPAPLREPLGFATITHSESGQASIDLGSTDRAQSVRLDGSLALRTALKGIALPLGNGTACTATSGSILADAFEPCAPGEAPPRLRIERGFDAMASNVVVSSRGEASLVSTTRTPDGVLTLRDDREHTARIEGVGAQVAVADLDQDGEPEILHALDVGSPIEDAVVVRSWKRAAPDVPTETLRLPAPAGVRAIAVCPPDGAGRAPFVVATADEIWVVR